MLPRVKIIYRNGALGAVASSPDGLLGYVISAAAVAGKFEQNKPYLLTSFDGLSALGITESNNLGIVELIREFYAEAGAGTQVYIMGVAPTVTMPEMLDYTQANNARRIIEVSRGAVRGIIIKHIPAAGYTPVIEDGLNADVYAAIAEGQKLGNWAAESKFAPIFVAVEGRDYGGDPTQLRALTEGTDSRVVVLIGGSAADGGAAMGLLGGRIAKSPVQRNIGRVKDGAVKTLTAYVGDVAAEQANVEAIHDKGYITFRTFVGRAGYFFSDDPTATLPTDDYKHLTYRRTIDKAYRIGYDTMLGELLDEIPVTAEGSIQPIYAKYLEGLIESAVATQMTANGELSADPSDPNDKGVVCSIDTNQKVISTGKLEVPFRVRPYGYSRYVDIPLGFQVTTE